jgi:hypothetical protein
LISLTTFLETSVYLQINKAYFSNLQGTLIGINHKNNMYKKEFGLLFSTTAKQENPDFMRFINHTNSKKPICQDVKLYSEPEHYLPSLNSFLSISANYDELYYFKRFIGDLQGKIDKIEKSNDVVLKPSLPYLNDYVTALEVSKKNLNKQPNATLESFRSIQKDMLINLNNPYVLPSFILDATPETTNELDYLIKNYNMILITYLKRYSHLLLEKISTLVKITSILITFIKLSLK